MKILHLDFDDLESPLGGGQAVRTFEINRRLAERGHKVTVVTCNYKNAINKNKNGISYERHGIKTYPLNLISYFLGVRSILKKHTFDLVLEDNIPPFTFGFSPFYTKKTVISQCQSFFAKQASQKYHLPFWALEKYGAKKYKNFIVLSNNIAEQIKELTPSAKIKIIPNGINNVPPLKTSEQNYALFLGRISFYHKGIDYLLSSAQILKNKQPGLKIIIAGRGIDEAKLKKLMLEKKLSNVEYIGKVEGKKKETLLQNCLMLLMPSRFETFGITALEAAAYGKPTIAFDIDNLNENIKSGIGITVKNFDVPAYANATIDLYNNSEKRHLLGQNAHSWAKQHLWDKIALEQEKFYLECLNAQEPIKKPLCHNLKPSQ